MRAAGTARQQQRQKQEKPGSGQLARLILAAKGQIPENQAANRWFLNHAWVVAFPDHSWRGSCPGMSTILLIILILLLLGALPTWPYSAGWGYYPSGGLGIILLIVIILLVMGRI
jgi:hypothetical protein